MLCRIYKGTLSIQWLLLNRCKHAPGRLWHSFARRREGSPQSTHCGGGHESQQAERFCLELAGLGLLHSKVLSDRQTGQMEAARTCPLMMVGPPSPTLPSPFLLPLFSLALGRGVSVTRAAEMPLRAGRQGCLSVLEAVKPVLGVLHGSTVLRPSMADSCIQRRRASSLGP